MTSKKEYFVYMDPQKGMGHNVYISLLENGLTKCKVKVIKNYKRFLKQRMVNYFSKNAFIYHTHFPDWAIRKEKLKTFQSTIYLFFKIIMLKIIGINIVRTVHDYGPLHALNTTTLFNKIFQKCIYKMSNRIIFLSINSKKLYLSRFGIEEKRRDKDEIVPLSGYGNYYPNNITKNEARKHLGIKSTAFVYMLFGRIRPHKNFTKIAKLFQKVDKQNAVLLIAGMKTEKEMDDAELANICKGDRRVIYHPTEIGINKVQNYFNAADLLILPYENNFCCGSGVLMLSIDYGLPTISYNHPYIADVLKEVAYPKRQIANSDQEMICVMNGINEDLLKKIRERILENKNKYSPNKVAEIMCHKAYQGL